ncbi:LPS export ABC transporter permease LptG [Grimontia hollisae]|uniref:Lipopolysaccharide export system permease protein lptG n=2 Tax=Grimontia hollisae TaxID=673 RepID=A0A377HIW0_GRIHO|nr:LPS export ABC transporter permease LptG [Grimontia hollisae]AMG31022.1 LPS export ABC transporter permease LptG [Grimontia hollisae]EEY72855.1 putative membrane protein [Grimontia hollisae CIP 101886]MDF2186634.1 LPS export ABC transporter permease LptG [Grimontia hollisae]STO46870.1 Lipopolysaccharide export system permease protein lptG [Grimontia hollisae]STO56221.1 Lipopolysaccharide export system permease protein lptG [Grimontia hollisae]
MFKILDLYIGRTIIATTSLCLATLVGLSAIIKFVEQLRSVGEGSFTMMTAVQYVLLSMPRDIEMFFPMAVLLGALIGLGTLASSSELVVMQAAGFSKLDIGLSVLKTAMPLMLVVLALGQWGAPDAQKAARELRAFAKSGGNVMSVRRGVWAKDGSDFIYIARTDQQESLVGVNIWKFDDTQTLKAQVFAEQARYLDKDSWMLENVTVTHFDGPVKINETTEKQLAWKTTLTPEKLSIVTVKPEELSLSGVYSYVDYLKASEQDASRYELALWRKVLQPLSIGVMMLLALSFVFGPLRSVTMGARVLSGVIFGFAFYISNEVFGPMTLVYNLPPFVGAIAPSLAFIGVTLYLLNRKL